MAGRGDAQARADRIGVFREELAQLEQELGGVLDDAQRGRITAHHDALLADLARQYDVATTTSGRQLALGLRLASFLGALALCIAVVLFVNRFWGALTTGTQVGLLTAGTLAMLGLTEFAARREKTLYFAGLAALVAFALFATDVFTLGSIFNLIPSQHAFLLLAAFGGALAYGYGFRVLLLAALISGALWVAGTLVTLGGSYWSDLFYRHESLLPAAVAAIALGFAPKAGAREGFGIVYRMFGFITFFWVVLFYAGSGTGSVLPLGEDGVEVVYQLLGFAAAALAIWAGIRRQWNHVTYTGVTAFVILLFIKAMDWWWDWMPRWLFFLVLGGMALAVMVVLKRLQARPGGAR